MAFKRQPPSYSRYAAANKNVIGVNWDEINHDRIQVGKKPFPEKTLFKK